MKRNIAPLLAAFVLASCGAPPSAPESLWETLPAPPISDGADPSTDVPAKSLPVQTWEEETPASGSSPDSPGEAPAEDLRGRIVVNEIYYDAVGADTDGVVFVELYGEAGLSVGGARLNFVDGGDGSVDDTITLPDGARLAEDGFYVVADARTGEAGATNVGRSDLIDNFDPQNGPEAIQLLGPDGGLLDAVGYGAVAAAAAENGLATYEATPAMDVLNGHSLERKEPGRDTDDNAADFAESETPTPGR